MRARAVAVLMVVGLVAVACGNEESGGSGEGSGRPGVTDDEIRVGGVVGKTNPVGRPYADAFVGVQAYFEMINEEEGGVFGKDLELVAERDDQSQASRNIQQVRALVEEDKVFAVLPVVTQIFAGATYLAEQGIPTFGWNINAEWSSGPNLFGEKGSFLCFDCPFIHPVYVAQQVGATNPAIFGYGNAAQSLDCAEGMRNGFETYGPPVAFEDISLSFGFTDLSATIEGIRENDVDFVATCMDVNGNANIAQAVKDAGIELKAVVSPEGYAADVLEDLGEKVEGFYFGSDFVPFEAPEGSEGMEQFLAAMEERDKTPSEQGLAGWVNATLFVEGLKAAGENFTQKKVVDAINEITDFTANGIVSEQDWTKDHAARPDADGCTALLQVQDGEFVPVFGEEGRPFVCFLNDQVAKTGPPDLNNPVIRGAASE
ncbi:MAG: ABC transporter substrate-binding protein [Actinobacteria bacterium]|nr:ABC transporter substrate-binding protein [Actinomycetota bacterium]